MAGEPPPVCFKSPTCCSHFMPPFLSQHCHPKMYRSVASCLYSGSVYLLLWCGSLYLPLRNYGGSPLNNRCRRFIQLPSHIFGPFILSSDLFSFIASAATSRWNLIRRGRYFPDFDKEFPNLEYSLRGRGYSLWGPQNILWGGFAFQLCPLLSFQAGLPAMNTFLLNLIKNGNFNHTSSSSER